MNPNNHIFLQNKKTPVEIPPVLNPVKKPTAPKPVDDKKKQHDALMDEFKKVHRKMFANQDESEAALTDCTDGVVSNLKIILGM